MWATVAIAAYTALKSYNQLEQGQSQAKAAVEQGQNEVTNAANNTFINAGKVRNSFLASGLSLDGGPLTAINQIINTGNTNIQRIATNANNTASNDIAAARTAALGTIAQGAMMAAGGFGGAGGDAGGVTMGSTSLAANGSDPFADAFTSNFSPNYNSANPSARWGF